MSEEGMRTLGRYNILGELGRGGFATVYRALDPTLDRTVALKVLHPMLLSDPTFTQRFRREAKALASLRHPQIVTIYEVNQAEGRLFIAMELANGLSLDREIAEKGPLPWKNVIGLFKPVCEALDYAHRQDIIHRDLKPANVLLDRDRGALLTDFGMARLMGSSSASMSMSGGILGTPAYISPELWELEVAGPQADIYALGCIAFEMLTGQVLFTGQSPMQILRSHDRGPQFPQAWAEGVPQGIDAILNRALARRPEDRFESALDFWQALSDLDAESALNQERSQRMAVAAQWRRDVEEAVSAGEWGAAKMAVGRWLAITPDDPAALAARAQIEKQLASTRPPVVQEQPKVSTEHQPTSTQGVEPEMKPKAVSQPVEPPPVEPQLVQPAAEVHPAEQAAPIIETQRVAAHVMAGSELPVAAHLGTDAAHLETDAAKEVPPAAPEKQPGFTISQLGPMQVAIAVLALVYILFSLSTRYNWEGVLFDLVFGALIAALILPFAGVENFRPLIRYGLMIYIGYNLLMWLFGGGGGSGTGSLVGLILAILLWMDRPKTVKEPGASLEAKTGPSAREESLEKPAFGRYQAAAIIAGVIAGGIPMARSFSYSSSEGLIFFISSAVILVLLAARFLPWPGLVRVRGGIHALFLVASFLVAALYFYAFLQTWGDHDYLYLQPVVTAAISLFLLLLVIGPRDENRLAKTRFGFIQLCLIVFSIALAAVLLRYGFEWQYYGNSEGVLLMVFGLAHIFLLLAIFLNWAFLVRIRVAVRILYIGLALLMAGMYINAMVNGNLNSDQKFLFYYISPAELITALLLWIDFSRDTLYQGSVESQPGAGPVSNG